MFHVYLHLSYLNVLQISKQFNNSLKLKLEARFFILLISSFSTVELSKTTCSSSSLYASHAITVKLDKRVSDNFNSFLHVAITLKSLLKSLNSFSSLVVNVPWNILY